MYTRKQISHSMIWLVVSTSTVIACKQSHESEVTKADAKHAAVEEEEKQPTPSEADSRAATAEKVPEIVVEDEKVLLAIDEKLTAAARDVATAMDAASSALDANDTTKAKAELANAISALARIEANRPSIGIAIELWRKQQELGIESLAGRVDTVPLLATVSRVDVPVYNREEIQARHEQRQSQASESVTQEVKSSDLRIIDSNLVYFEVDLPIAASEIAVVQAQRLLDEGKPAEAKAALVRGIESVGVVDIVLQAPEFRARQMVWDAENAFLHGNKEDAKQLLDKAHELLAPLAQRDDDPQAKLMVTTLLDEMKPLRDALTAGVTGEEHVNIFRRTSRSVLDFARRAALRTKMSRHHNQERFALVDALMWLESARGESDLRPDSHMVIRELEIARDALTKAAEAAPSSAKPNLDDLHARVNHIIELDNATPRDPKLVQSELNDVIFDLHMLMLDLQAMPTHRHHVK